MEYDVELEVVPGRDQTEETLVVRWADGATERMRLHEYERVYAIPGLYEEVVQRRLECASPATLADLLVECAAQAAMAPGELRVFDLGAGNGVVGEQLRARGVGTLVASDNIAAARDAALRDRPGLYEEYLVGDTDDLPRAAELVADLALNGLVAAGALGLGHISAASFDRLWSAFAPGSILAASVPERLAGAGQSDFGDYLAAIEDGASASELVVRRRFRHRLSMAGDPLHYVAVAVRRLPAQPSAR